MAVRQVYKDGVLVHEKIKPGDKDAPPGMLPDSDGAESSPAPSEPASDKKPKTVKKK